MRKKSRGLVLPLVFISLILVSSDSWANGEPYFRTCNVKAFNTPGGIKTSVNAQVYDPNGTVPASISSLTVSEPGGFAYSFSASDYGEYYNQYWHSLAGLPTDGEYTFTVTDSEGKSATSRFYLTVSNFIPIPDSSTLQASGNALAPTLSWGAPSTYEGNLFYRARIFDTSGNTFWTSNFTTRTSVDVPSGILAPSTDYDWRVEAFDDESFHTSNNRAVSQTVALTSDNETPFFVFAGVFKRVDSSGTWTVLAPTVVDPNGVLPGLTTIRVTGPGEFDQTLDSTHYDPQFNEYYLRLSGSPTAGIYQFMVTDSEGKTATSYDYLASADMPMVGAATLQASGDPLAPRLSWGAPSHNDQSLYFRVKIYEGTTWNQVYGTGRSPHTAVQVPAGLLQAGVAYEWHVRAEDSRYWPHYNAQSRSDRVVLSIDNSRPNFDSAIVYNRIQPDGVFTAMDIDARDPNGTVPDSIASLVVTGPGGFRYDFQPEDYGGSYFHIISGEPQAGVYTVTVTDNEGKTAVTNDYFGGSVNIPPFDESTIAVNGPALTPTISWSGISGYQGRLYYRIWVAAEDKNSWIYGSSRQSSTAQTVPAGYLEGGKAYDFRVEAYDQNRWIIYDNRRNSNWFPHTTRVRAAMPWIPLLLLED